MNAPPRQHPTTEGMHVVVTGAGGGIGRAISVHLAQKGFKLLLADVDEASVNQTARLSGADARALICNVESPSDVEEVMEALFGDSPAMAGLVNCAGIFPIKPFLDMDISEWRQVIDANLTGTFLCGKSFSGRARAHSIPASIVNISSTAASVARAGIAHYAASKAAINQLTRVMAIELGCHGITVNAVCPGVIGTEHVRELADLNPRDHALKLAHIPLGRMGTPEEVARAVAFLLDSKSRYITGSVMTVDGGYSCGIPSINHDV